MRRSPGTNKNTQTTEMTQTYDENHDRYASRTVEVDRLPTCGDCKRPAGYMYHRLYTEPTYCADHLAVPPYTDQIYARLVEADSNESTSD